MTVEKYPTESTVSKLIFSFKSVGIKIIEKKVIFTPIEDSENYGLPPMINLYNLAFGDWDESVEDIDDTVRSNNGDTDKVLATVANTVIEFWAEYPNLPLFLTGSTPSRTRKYQIGISKNYAEINEKADVYGMFNYKWERYRTNKNYDAFLILKKRELF
jgi:hypothetical protein